MKNYLLVLFAAAALVGCRQGDEVNEPAGAERNYQMERGTATDTNAINAPSGTATPEGAGSSTDSDASTGSGTGSSTPPDSSGTPSNP